MYIYMSFPCASAQSRACNSVLNGAQKHRYELTGDTTFLRRGLFAFYINLRCLRKRRLAMLCAFFSSVKFWLCISHFLFLPFHYVSFYCSSKFLLLFAAWFSTLPHTSIVLARLIRSRIYLLQSWSKLLRLLELLDDARPSLFNVSWTWILFAFLLVRFLAFSNHQSVHLLVLLHLPVLSPARLLHLPVLQCQRHNCCACWSWHHTGSWRCCTHPCTSTALTHLPWGWHRYGGHWRRCGGLSDHSGWPQQHIFPKQRSQK